LTRAAAWLAARRIFERTLYVLMLRVDLLVARPIEKPVSG